MIWVTESSRARVILVALALVIAVGASTAMVAFGDGDDVTFYGCLNPAGALNSVSVDTAPNCPPKSQLISWNQKGEKGDPGDPGTFSGEFTSPNGLYSISVTDDGIVLSGPASTITVDATGVEIDGTNVTVTGSGVTRVQGTIVQLNCPSSSGAGVARVGDPVSSNSIDGGSATVQAC